MSEVGPRSRLAPVATRQPHLARRDAAARRPDRVRNIGRVMKEPANTVTIAISGIGELTNEFRQ
jgi:hypothetical protein